MAHTIPAERIVRVASEETASTSDKVAARWLAGCQMINNGRQVVLEFKDGSKYEVHAAWLKDSTPAARGPDFYRTSASDVWKLNDFVVTDVRPAGNGEQMELMYDANGESWSDTLDAEWLHALAPFVGKGLHPGAEQKVVRGTGSMLGRLERNRKPWYKDAELPVFDFEELATSLDAQARFLENIVDPGIAMITNMPKVESMKREDVGKPIQILAWEVIGKLNQHPVRATQFGVMSKTAESAKQGADYNMENPLSMHTDHTVYHGTPGYIQYLFQAEGTVRSKVCDGLALAEYFREHHPREFELLTTVDMTHSSRNTLYSREGAPRSVYDQSTQAAPFELVHTHPVIQLDADGQVEKVIQSETKRGVCALPYDVYHEWLQAYEMWTRACEDERFVKHFHWPEGTCIVTNNHRTLHGRASVPPGMARTMVFGYQTRWIVENRYRLVKQLLAEREKPNMDDRWLTRLPNQVLEHLV